MQMPTWPRLKRSLVAILRGVKPDEVESIGEKLIHAGFEMIEVPLNSPDPLRSIERLARRFGAECIVGAGTVLTVADCTRVCDAGGRLMVSPNIDLNVLATARARGMISLPGVFSPTEALAAQRAGASALKFFRRRFSARQVLPPFARCCRRRPLSSPWAVCPTRTSRHTWPSACALSGSAAVFIGRG